MTVEQFVSDITTEFDEYGMIPYTLMEDNLQLIFDNFTEWKELLESDVFKEFLLKLEDPTTNYHDRVEFFTKQQRKGLVKNSAVMYSIGFEGFEGFEIRIEGKKHIFNPQLIPDLSLFIHAVMESLQVDAGMIAPAVLSVASVSVVKKCVIHPNGDHIEPPNLYISVISEASERKSPTMKAVIWPLYEYEQEENERRQPDISQYKLEKKILEGRLKNLTEKAVKAKKEKEVYKADVMEAQRELDELEEVTEIRLVADDVTAEALIRLMSQNDERIAILSTEGGIFGNIAGRYSNTSNMDIYLKGYSGDSLSDDRVGRKGHKLKEPLLSILIYVQPIIIKQLMENEEFVGRGLPARFLYIRPYYDVTLIAVRREKSLRFLGGFSLFLHQF